MIRKFIHLYPERTDGDVSEVWQAKKWAEELGSDSLTPMAIGKENQHFYVNELARTTDGRYIIPLKWFTMKKELHCDCFKVELCVSRFH